ncbi:NAD(P)H-hydrate dehydratase [Brevundimonas sp. R86498]|uniref:NAD(P)H-hydrate dehydratase n=1 Tax=Brevundimonas sp. R86498 TaxID=3093845 RepID=UPI0037C990D8
MNETNDPALWRDLLPRPGADTHKHRRGRLGVVSGGPLQTGAARLAARAGLRIGAGLVRLLCPPDAALIVAAAVEAVMVDAFETPEALATLTGALDAVVIGPAAGLIPQTEANLAALSATAVHLVVDADALTLFKGRPDALFALLRPGDVLTPHEGEFERLFPGLLADGRATAATVAARRCGATVILKGHETVIASPGGRLRIDRNGSAWLATAGSGDVLAGMTGGLIAQGMEPFEAASAAVWIHAAAADRFGVGLTAGDLPDLVPGVLAGLA